MSDKIIRIFPSSHTFVPNTELLEKAKEYLHQSEVAENVRIIESSSLTLIEGAMCGAIECPSCHRKLKLDMMLESWNYFHSSYNSAGKEHQYAFNDELALIKYDKQLLDGLNKSLSSSTVENILMDMPCCNSSVSFSKLDFGNIFALARIEFYMSGEVDFFGFIENPHLENISHIIGAEFRAFIYAD